MLAVVWLFVVANLQTTVRPDGLYIRFYPFHLSQRKIPLEKVVSFRALTYRPIRDYGGWGLRFGKGGRAVVNPDSGCECGPPTQDSTWGKVKTLYGR